MFWDEHLQITSRRNHASYTGDVELQSTSKGLPSVVELRHIAWNFYTLSPLGQPLLP